MAALIVILLVVTVGAGFGIAHALKTARQVGLPEVHARQIQDAAQSTIEDIREETRRAEERMLRAAFFHRGNQSGRWGQ